MTAVDKRY